MSHVIGRFSGPIEEGSEEENNPRRVISGPRIPYDRIIDTSSFKNCRLVVGRNAARFESTQCNRTVKEHVRRKNCIRKKENPFVKYNVPDLALDYIFSGLRKRDLCAAMLCCRRFYEIGKTSRNWKVTDVAERPVSEVSLAALMRKNVRVLRLAGARPLPDPRLSNRLFDCALSVTTRLEVLDLSRANLSLRQLLIVLKPCRQLRFLSLEGNQLDDDVARCVSDNRELRELDLSMTNGLSEIGVFNIAHNCQQLEALNVAWCGMSTYMLHLLIENLTKKLLKLNVSGSARYNGLTDEHIEMLTTACLDICDLDVSDNVQLSNRSIFLIMERLENIHTLSINRCYGIDPNVIVHLNQLKPLKNLNCHGCITDANMGMFVEMCGRLRCNRQVFNYTAKPSSNPSNNATIWGRRVTERH